MKKLFAIVILFAAAYQSGIAQTTTVTGFVRDKFHQPVHYAFIIDKHTQNATYTDSLGTFRLAVDPASQLAINCEGYLDTSVVISGHNSFDLVLKAAPAAQAGTGNSVKKSDDEKILEKAFRTDNIEMEGVKAGLNDVVVFGNLKETVGSRFFFNKWEKGHLITVKGQILQSPSMEFNYEKMKGYLFINIDHNMVRVANKDVIKSFVIVGAHDEQLTFERMTGISADLFCQVICTGNKYKIYKLVTTKYIPAGITTNGITSTGNGYAEFVDEDTYFIQNLVTTMFQPLYLRKKSFKEVFAPEGDKLNSFIASHGSKFDEKYVINLCNAMNL